MKIISEAEIDVNELKVRFVMRKSILTEADYNLFYKSIIYGNVNDSIKSSIKSAYRDVCRTITGFSKMENHDNILNNASSLVYTEINSLLIKKIKEQSDFDKWHKECCDKLISTFDKQLFSYGQAQKWINMSLKNLSMLEHKLIEKQYEFFHVPIDNYIVDITGIKISVAWSRISNYDEYIEFQNKFRDTYEGIPLDNEFKLWLKATRNV